MVIRLKVDNRFQNKRAKVKKGNNSPIMDDHDQGNLFTPHKIDNKGFIPTTLPTPPGSVFMRGNNFAQDSNDGSVYPSISPNLEFWNGDSSNGDLPTGPLSFVGSRSEIISKRPLFCIFFILTLLVDYFNSQNIQENLNNESPSSPVKLKSGNLDQEFYMKSSSKDESLIVNFMIPVPSGHHMASSDLLNESSNFENCYNIFRDSPERNLFHS